MAKDALERLERTVLFQTLQAREEETRAGHEISERVKAVVGHVAPLLERVPEKMPEFTLHDPNHGAKVVELMAQFLPADTLARLNVVELSILIYAAYLHDLGMTCSTDEREETIRSDAEFARLLAADETRSLRLQRLREESDHRAASAVEDQVFTEYLRRTHVRRSARFIEETLDGGDEESALAISWQGTPYSRWVRAVCDSHELPVSRLRDTKTWPRDALVRNLRVNVQYLSLVLRLADILDLDPERTPKVLLDFINPKDPTSVREWHKHRSVIGWEITPERIRFEAVCAHPVYERALREFLDWIEDERRDSVLLASSYRDELSEVYRFDLTEPVTKDRVRSDGSYIYSDLRFNIDYQRVLNLLMGERLYGNPVVALRELLQNSVDAVRLRQALCERDGEPFEPHIAVKLEGDTLVVEDNGVGMDEHIVKNYFMQVGRSYYRSPEFRARQLDIDPVSEFGIGILSVFMVADRCEVESRRHPDDPLNPQPPVRIEIPTAYDYFVQRHTDRTHIGTTITLHLKPNHPFKPDELLERISGIAPFIEYSILIETPEGQVEYQPRKAGEPVDDSERFFIIPLEGLSDPRLAGIRGSVYINSDDNKGGGIIAQRGFAIADWEDFQRSLFPTWTKVKKSVDFRGPVKLSLTPDRGGIIRDERFSDLQSALEDEIVRAFRAHLKAQRDSKSRRGYEAYVDELFKSGALSAVYVGKLSEGFTNLFLDLIPLPCINKSGNFSRCYGRDLEGAPTIALTDQGGWPTTVSVKQVQDALGSSIIPIPPLLLIAENANRTWLSFLNSILREIQEGVLISDIPGIVFDLIQASDDTDAWLSMLYRKINMSFSASILSPHSDRIPVLVHSPSRDSLSYPTFNPYHPLLSPLLLGYELNDPEEQKELHVILNSFSGRIGEIFNELADGTALIIKKPSGGYVDREENPNAVLVGVLRREPALLDSLREAFIECWEEARAGNIIGEDLPFPGLTAEDLPWFWSYEEKQGKSKARRGGRGRKEGHG